MEFSVCAQYELSSFSSRTIETVPRVSSLLSRKNEMEVSFLKVHQFIWQSTIDSHQGLMIQRILRVFLGLAVKIEQG